jgi:hypothetical protein
MLNDSELRKALDEIALDRAARALRKLRPHT